MYMLYVLSEQQFSLYMICNKFHAYYFISNVLSTYLVICSRTYYYNHSIYIYDIYFNRYRGRCGSEIAIFMRQLGRLRAQVYRWIEHRQNLQAIKRFRVDEKSSPDICVATKNKKNKEKKKKWQRFYPYFFLFFFSVGKL